MVGSAINRGPNRQIVREKAEVRALELDPMGLQPWELTIEALTEDITLEEDCRLRREAEGRWYESCSSARFRGEKIINDLGLDLSGFEDSHYLGKGQDRDAYDHIRHTSQPGFEYLANGHHYICWSPEIETPNPNGVESSIWVTIRDSEDGFGGQEVYITPNHDWGEASMRFIIGVSESGDGYKPNKVRFEIYDPDRDKYACVAYAEFMQSRMGSVVRCGTGVGQTAETGTLIEDEVGVGVEQWQNTRRVFEDDYGIALPESPFSKIDFRATAQAILDSFRDGNPHIVEPILQG